MDNLRRQMFILFSKIKIIFPLAAGLIILAGCQSDKIIHIPIRQQHSLVVNQKLPTKINPAQFYLCGNDCYPCHHSTNRWSGLNKKTIKKTHQIYRKHQGESK
ncbi:MAG: hypothetical protein ACYCQI_17050 [Gammaproteobacteria bacterium]